VPDYPRLTDICIRGRADLPLLICLLARGPDPPQEVQTVATTITIGGIPAIGRFIAGRWYTDNEGLSQENVHALLVTRALRREDTVNRARSIAATQRLPAPAQRRGIPDDVKLLVMQRDGGACRECGSTAELQFDHVIPVSLGGGSTEDNLQILCGPCNRRKGASVI